MNTHSKIALAALAVAAAVAVVPQIEAAPTGNIGGTSSTRCYEDGSCEYFTTQIVEDSSPLKIAWANKRSVAKYVSRYIGPDAEATQVHEKWGPVRVHLIGVDYQGKFGMVLKPAGRTSTGKYRIHITIAGSYCMADQLCEKE